MEITEVRVFPIQDEKLKAFVSVVLDHCFMVNDIKVIQGRDSKFISMPSRRKRNGRFKDVAHPLNNETRQMMERRILAEYARVAGEAEAGEGLAPEPAPAPVTAPAVAAPAVATPPPAPPTPERPAPQAGETPPAAGAVQAAPDAVEAEEEQEADPSEKPSLEEVAELHLRDSFWTT